MAEAIAAIGLLASVASLIDITSRSLSRLQEYRSADGQLPILYQDVADQLPLVLEVMQKLQDRLQNRSLDQHTSSAFSSALNGCNRQIFKIQKNIEKRAPATNESNLKRIRKAFGSAHDEKNLIESLRVLETYKTTIHMYLTNSTYDAHLDTPDAIYDIPSRQLSFFVGRQDILKTLSDHLEDGTTPSARRKAAILTGMGGQGKTQIALEYCLKARMSRTYGIMIWIDASTENTLIRTFSNIVEKLPTPGLSFPDDNSRVSHVKAFLSQTPQRWLLIFDNFDRPDLFPNIKDFFPASNNGALIVTSRHTGSERLGTPIAVPKMSEDESILLLLHRANAEMTQGNKKYAMDIAQKLGHLPLALDQAGSYLSSRDLPISSFLEHFSHRRTLILKHTPAFWEYHKQLGLDEDETTMNAFTTFELSFDQMTDDDERLAVSHFLTLSAFLGPASIGMSLFRDYLLSTPKVPYWASRFLTDRWWDFYKYQDFVAALRARSLLVGVDFATPENTFDLHPLVREWLRLRIPQSERSEYVRESIQQVAASAFGQRYRLDLQGRRTLVAHIDACSESAREVLHLDGLWNWSLSPKAADALAFIYNAHGRYKEAASFYQSLYDRQNVIDAPHTLRIAMNLANILRNQGQLNEAEALYESVVTNRERQLGPFHPETLRALGGLANVHSLQNNFKQADIEHRQLIHSHVNTKDKSTCDVVRIIEGLANIRRHQSRYNVARALYGEALEQRFKNLGPRHPDTLRCVQGLTIVYRHQSRLEESVHLYKEILEALELELGNDHPHTLRTALNFSIAYYHQQNLVAAESMAVRAYEGFETLLGPDHEETKRAADQLANIRQTNRLNSNTVCQQAMWLPEVVENLEGPESGPVLGCSGETLLQVDQYLAQLSLISGKRDIGNPSIHSGAERPFPPSEERHGERESHLTGKVLDRQDEKLDLKSVVSQQLAARLQKDEHLDTANWYGPRPIGSDSLGLIRLLFEHYGLQPDMKDSNGETALSRAERQGDSEVVDFLEQR